MNMPNLMSKFTYTTWKTEIRAAVVDTAVKVTERPACVIRIAYCYKGVMEDKDGVMDITHFR